MDPQFKPIADHALLVSFADEISDDAHALVLSLNHAIAVNPPVGFLEAVPALVNLLVSFDVLKTDHRAVEGHIRALLEGAEIQETSGSLCNVQVCYEGDFAPDLEAVATAKGLSTEAVINAHLAGDYRVMMYGFAPGYAYMAGVSDRIQVPRKASAIRDVPAGSVIIAGPQCLVTTLTMPTGWSIIGRSPTPILTGDTNRPFLFDVGSRVRFKRIDLTTFERLNIETAHV